MLRGDAERKKKKDGGIPLNRDGLGVMIEAGEEKKTGFTLQKFRRLSYCKGKKENDVLLQD